MIRSPAGPSVDGVSHFVGVFVQFLTSVVFAILILILCRVVEPVGQLEVELDEQTRRKILLLDLVAAHLIEWRDIHAEHVIVCQCLQIRKAGTIGIKAGIGRTVSVI